VDGATDPNRIPRVLVLCAKLGQLPTGFFHGEKTKQPFLDCLAEACDKTQALSQILGETDIAFLWSDDRFSSP
jgi:hypothetical protein